MKSFFDKVKVKTSSTSYKVEVRHGQENRKIVFHCFTNSSLKSSTVSYKSKRKILTKIQ